MSDFDFNSPELLSFRRHFWPFFNKDQNFASDIVVAQFECVSEATNTNKYWIIIGNIHTTADGPLSPWLKDYTGYVHQSQNSLAGWGLYTIWGRIGTTTNLNPGSHKYYATNLSRGAQVSKLITQKQKHGYMLRYLAGKQQTGFWWMANFFDVAKISQATETLIQKSAAYLGMHHQNFVLTNPKSTSPFPAETIASPVETSNIVMPDAGSEEAKSDLILDWTALRMSKIEL